MIYNLGLYKYQFQEQTQQNHLISAPCRSLNTVSQQNIEWFELEGTLKILYFQPSAMGRDTFHHIRLLKASSSPVLKHLLR